MHCFGCNLDIELGQEHIFSGYGYYISYHPECCPKSTDMYDCPKDHPEKKPERINEVVEKVTIGVPSTLRVGIDVPLPDPIFLPATMVVLPDSTRSLEQYQEIIHRIESIVEAQQAEIVRLKRGDFTPEEFQELCHNRHEAEGCTFNDFCNGCIEFQKKLFGKDSVTEAIAAERQRGLDIIAEECDLKRRHRPFSQIQEAITRRIKEGK